jgi:hypothetical protein
VFRGVFFLVFGSLFLGEVVSSLLHVPTWAGVVIVVVFLVVWVVAKKDGHRPALGGAHAHLEGGGSPADAPPYPPGTARLLDRRAAYAGGVSAVKAAASETAAAKLPITPTSTPPITGSTARSCTGAPADSADQLPLL